MANTEFSKYFLWGAATAAPQIEGGYLDDGRTPSIWDTAPAEKIKGNANCHEACDHYHRMREDVAIMKEIGLKSYRFSVSWSRVIPKEGVVNKKGIQFYIDLVDELRANNIEPMVTIFHWDLPVWVYEKGGCHRRPLWQRQDHAVQPHGAVLGCAVRQRVPRRAGCA